MRSEEEIQREISSMYSLFNRLKSQESEERMNSVGNAIADFEWALTKSEKEIKQSLKNLQDLLYCPSTHGGREKSIRESIHNLSWVLQI